MAQKDTFFDPHDPVWKYVTCRKCVSSLGVINLMSGDKDSHVMSETDNSAVFTAKFTNEVVFLGKLQPALHLYCNKCGSFVGEKFLDSRILYLDFIGVGVRGPR